MAAYVQQSIGLGTVPNDDTGDDLRTGGDKINNNFDEIFGAQAFEAGGALAVTYDAIGNVKFGMAVTIGDGAGTPLNTSVDDLVITDLTAAGMSILSADGQTSSIFFGNVTDAKGAEMAFADGSSTLVLGTAKAGATMTIRTADQITALTLDASQTAVFFDDVDPAVTEIQNLGAPLSEWDNIFLQNAPTVSDKRRKNDLGPVDKKLIDLMRKLDPRIFSRKTRVVKKAVPEQTELKPKTKTVLVNKITTEIIDGVPTRRTIKVKQQVLVGKMVQIVDENGTALPDKIIPAVKNDFGKIIEPEKSEPQLQFVSEIEKVIIPAEPEVIAKHGRPHTGFMAQNVKQAMTDVKVDDWAGYAYHDDEGEDTHVLRLQEFIAPMLAYIQELEARLEKLESA